MARRPDYYLIEIFYPRIGGPWAVASATWPIYQSRPEADRAVRTLRADALSGNIRYRVAPLDYRNPKHRERDSR